MDQRQIDFLVARATGESLATVQRIGFLLADEDSPADDIEDCQCIDWDTLALTRQSIPNTEVGFANA